MMQFEVRALGKNGVSALSIDAADAHAALRQASEQGYTVLAVRAQHRRRARTERFSLLLFTQELTALLRAGLGLVEAMRALAERHETHATHSMLESLLRELRIGKPLSAALAQFPHVFPPLYVEGVRASERTGALVEALLRYVEYQGQIDQVRQKLTSALIYPLLLIVVGLLVTLFLLGFVVPRFSGIYADMGRDLPLASQLLFELGALIDRNGALAAVATGLIVTAAIVLARSQAARFGLVLSRIPVFGERLQTYRLTRLYRTLGMLLRGGIPLVSALDMAGGMLDSGSRARLANAARLVREGGSLSSAFKRNALATPIAARMLEVGERSGDLSGLIEQAAGFHEQELGRWVERSTRLFEPLLMMFIGLLIGAIVVLMYMPIFDLASSLQ
jgi:general secretion pathway protein F